MLRCVVGRYWVNTIRYDILSVANDIIDWLHSIEIASENSWRTVPMCSFAGKLSICPPIHGYRHTALKNDDGREQDVGSRGPADTAATLMSTRGTIPA